MIASAGRPDDPNGFVDVCRLLFVIEIGSVQMPVDISALDAWMAVHCTDKDAIASYERKRQSAVTAFVANQDDDSLGHAIEDMHELVHLLRALPLATTGAKIKRSQSQKASKPRKLLEGQEARIRRQYAEMVAKGEAYGAQKALAAQHGVSVSTIKAVIAAGRKSLN